MTAIMLKQELPEEFLSDILITAFDGTYGSSWGWFEPVHTKTSMDGTHWLQRRKGEKPSDDIWLSAHVRLRDDCLYGHPLFDTREGFVIDHNSIAGGLSRIINDDYAGLWRDATEHEVREILMEFGSGTSTGSIRGQKFRWESSHYEIESAETARGHRASLTQETMNAINTGDWDFDAADADVIVQAAAFGKVVFS